MGDVKLKKTEVVCISFLSSSIPFLSFLVGSIASPAPPPPPKNEGGVGTPLNPLYLWGSHTTQDTYLTLVSNTDIKVWGGGGGGAAHSGYSGCDYWPGDRILGHPNLFKCLC